MRFLFLTTLYPVKPGHSWMSSDLANSLRKRGHDVDVVLLDWTAEAGRATREVTTAEGVRVIDIAPRAITRLGAFAYRASKMLMSQPHAVKELEGRIDPGHYDALVAFTPASTLAGPLRKLAAAIRTRILFIFDFYPWVQRDLGLIPEGPLFTIALRREERLYRMFTSIFCNLPGNIRYLKKHYRIRPDTRLDSTPLWSVITPAPTAPRAEIRERFGLPHDRPIAVFGGQITDGRGIELMLDAAAEGERAGDPLMFLFIGDGRLAATVDERAKTASNVRRIAGQSRDDYLRIASACDVGIAATVPGVNSFNFPTKTIDYLRVGLPVCSAVEPGNDYVDILTRWQVGDGVEFTDPIAFFRTAARLASDPAMKAKIGANAERCLVEFFDVEHTTDKVLAAIEPAARSKS